MSDRAPAYRDPALHFGALGLAALLEGGRMEEALATENEGKCLYVHLRTYTQPTDPRSFLLLGHRLQPTPSPLCELA
jgi:hypothetical protein